MAWFSLSTQFFHDDRVTEVTLVTRYAVIAVIGYVKTFGARGKVHASAKEIAKVMYVPETAIDDALKTGMFSVNGKDIEVLNWQDYQIDSTNADRQKRHRDNKSGKVTGVTLHNASNADSTGQDIYPPTPLKGAEEALALLIRTSDYGTNIPMNDFNLAKARQSLKDHSWDQVVSAIERVGKQAKYWGLIDSELKKIKAERQAADEADNAAQKRVEETRSYIRSIKEKCGITE